MSNFAFNSLSAYLLGPSRYGTLAAITAFLLALRARSSSRSRPFPAVRRPRSLHSGSEARVRGLARFYGLRVGFAGTLCAVAVALLKPARSLVRECHLRSGIPIAIGGGIFVFSGVTHLQRGVFLGAEEYRRYALRTRTVDRGDRGAGAARCRAPAGSGAARTARASR